MKRLIVNADDFGLHTYINQGIVKGHREGFITSASLMCSAPAFSEAVALAKDCPRLGVGLHLTLVGGVESVLPPDDISTLVNTDGRFFPDYTEFAKRFYTGKIKKTEIERELRSQFERALGVGISITHVDGHQHLHVLPGIAGLVFKLCSEYGIKKIRIPKESYMFKGGFAAGAGRLAGRAGLTLCAQLAAAIKPKLIYTEHFFGMLAGGNLNTELVGNILEALPEGTSELMTHPGVSGQELRKVFPWHYHWEEELMAYLAPENKALLKKNNIRLINFGDL